MNLSKQWKKNIDTWHAGQEKQHSQSQHGVRAQPAEVYKLETLQNCKPVFDRPRVPSLFKTDLLRNQELVYTDFFWESIKEDTQVQDSQNQGKLRGPNSAGQVASKPASRPSSSIHEKHDSKKRFSKRTVSTVSKITLEKTDTKIEAHARVLNSISVGTLLYPNNSSNAQKVYQGSTSN